MRVETFPEGATPDALRRQVRAMQREAWPSASRGGAIDRGPIHDPALRPLSMLLVEDGTVLSALDMLFKRVAHAGQEWSAAGLSTVVTPRALRGRGYGRSLVTWAREALPALEVDLGLFTCDRPLGAFYRSCGWELLPGTVLVGGTADQPLPSDQPGFDKVTLAAFVTDSGDQARASLLDSRVMLYSGDLDRLW